MQTVRYLQRQFYWTWDTIAPEGVLDGVHVFNDTNVIVGGQFWLNDSNGVQEPNYYNFAQWNGKTWHYSRIVEENGFLYTISGIVAFSPMDYWLFNGNVMYWNGTTIQTILASANTGWGTSSNDMYFIGGGNGYSFLYHYNNGSWHQIQTGTSLNIPGIWGGINPQTGKEEVICVASNEGGTPNIREIFIVNGSTVIPLSDSELAVQLSSIWFSPGEYLLYVWRWDLL